MSHRVCTDVLMRHCPPTSIRGVQSTYESIKGGKVVVKSTVRLETTRPPGPPLGRLFTALLAPVSTHVQMSCQPVWALRAAVPAPP